MSFWMKNRNGSTSVAILERFSESEARKTNFESHFQEVSCLLTSCAFSGPHSLNSYSHSKEGEKGGMAGRKREPSSFLMLCLATK